MNKVANISGISSNNKKASMILSENSNIFVKEFDLELKPKSTKKEINRILPFGLGQQPNQTIRSLTRNDRLFNDMS